MAADINIFCQPTVGMNDANLGPVIVSVTPDSFAATDAGAVTILGENLRDDLVNPTLTLGGVPLSLNSVSLEEVDATWPANTFAPGVYDLTFYNNSGSYTLSGAVTIT